MTTVPKRVPAGRARLAATPRAHYGPPASGARAPKRLSAIGASPSGKAADFDSAIRRFESSRPSHTFPASADLAETGGKPGFPRAFAGADIADQCARPVMGSFPGLVSNPGLPVSGTGGCLGARRVRTTQRPVRNCAGASGNGKRSTEAADYRFDQPSAGPALAPDPPSARAGCAPAMQASDCPALCPRQWLQ